MGEMDLQHYPSIRRLPIGRQADCKPKTVMSASETEKIFNGQRLVVEEKFNGTAKMFHADNGRFTILSEDMLRYKPGLTGRYSVPSRYVVWDIFDNKRKVFVSFLEKEDIFKSIKQNEIHVKERNSYDFMLASVLAHGCSFRPEDMPAFLDMLSRYAMDLKTERSTYMEGIVIKPAREMFFPEYERLVSKLIRNEYLYGKTGIEENYMRLPVRYNNINPRYGLEDPNFWKRRTSL